MIKVIVDVAHYKCKIKPKLDLQIVYRTLCLNYLNFQPLKTQYLNIYSCALPAALLINISRVTCYCTCRESISLAKFFTGFCGTNVA